MNFKCRAIFSPSLLVCGVCLSVCVCLSRLLATVFKQSFWIFFVYVCDRPRTATLNFGEHPNLDLKFLWRLGLHIKDNILINIVDSMWMSCRDDWPDSFDLCLFLSVHPCTSFWRGYELSCVWTFALWALKGLRGAFVWRCHNEIQSLIFVKSSFSKTLLQSGNFFSVITEFWLISNFLWMPSICRMR